MTVRAALNGVTLTSGEIAAASAAGQDAVGMLNVATQAAADCSNTITAITNVIGAGANKTALLAQVTALS